MGERGIKLNDVYLDKGTICIRRNKIHKECIIPISDDVKEILENYIKILMKLNPTSQYLFPSFRGGCYKSKWISNYGYNKFF